VKALITGGRPLSLFDSQEMQGFITALDPGYTAPSRKIITQRLLPQVYSEIKHEVIQRIIRPAHSLNIIFDGSEDYNGRRIYNISVSIPHSNSIFWKNIDTGSSLNTSENIAALVRAEIIGLVGGDLSKINAFCTDTCAGARLHGKILREFPELQHTFYVLCDSHGLQLLIGDLLKLKPWSHCFNEAEQLISFFRASKLQFSRLRDQQKALYSKNYSILAA
jgi:hypothetical protein